MNELKCEKVERELELNGQKAKFVASTLNLDYVIIDKTLYLGLDCYDKVIKDVRAEFASDEAIRTRAERIVAANAAFSFVVAKEYGDCQIAVYAKEKLGYVALYKSDNLLYVQFVWQEYFSQKHIVQIPTMNLKEYCRQSIKSYQGFLQCGEPERDNELVWIQDVFKDEQDAITRDVEAEPNEHSFTSACLHCGEPMEYDIEYSRCISKCTQCGAVFSVKTKIYATAIHYITRIR